MENPTDWAPYSSLNCGGAFLPFLPLQQQFATRNNVGTTRTCRATAVRLARRPILSPLERLCPGVPGIVLTNSLAGPMKTGSSQALLAEKVSVSW
jgi:hypothetical protein